MSVKSKCMPETMLKIVGSFVKSFQTCLKCVRRPPTGISGCGITMVSSINDVCWCASSACGTAVWGTCCCVGGTGSAGGGNVLPLVVVVLVVVAVGTG